MIKIPLTWHLWNITIPKTPYISSLKSLGYCTFWNFWACQKKITFDIFFGSPCTNIFYSSQATWRHVAINPYPLNGSSALHLFGSQQSQLRAMKIALTAQQVESWQQALQVQRARIATAFTSRVPVGWLNPVSKAGWKNFWHFLPSNNFLSPKKHLLAPHLQVHYGIWWVPGSLHFCVIP